MYKLLIVDDEEHIRSGLQSLIEWEIYGIEVVGAASDGMKAYVMIKSSNPDIVLIDINMPNMNGIELMDFCAHSDIRPRFIVLSGYNDFKYVQKALQLGAVNYLLKPIDQDELCQAIISCVNLLDDEHKSKLHIQESTESLRNDTLLRVLHNNIDFKELREKCQVLDLSLHCSCMHVGIITITNADSEKIIPLFDISHVCNEICLRCSPCYTVASIPDSVYVIFKDKTHAVSNETYQSALEECSEETNNTFHLSSIYALGLEVSHISQLPDSFENAETILEKKKIFDIIPNTSLIKISELPEIDYAAFLTYIEEEQNDKITEFIHNYCFQFYENESINEASIESLKYRLIELVTYVLHSKYVEMYLLKETKSKKAEAFSIIKSTSSVQQLENYISSYFLSLMTHTQSELASKGYPFRVQNLIDNIHTNYADYNLSLKTLANEMNINPAYLGREFTLATGEYFSDYLNKIRIAKSIHLLNTTTWKISKIANSVVFSNTSYFFTIFKKVTGKRPGDSRSEMISDHVSLKST